MNRLHLKKIFSGIVLVSILTVTGTLSSLICPAETVRASDTLSNPMILLSMPGRKSPGTASGSEAIRSLKSQQKMDKFTKN